MDTEDHYLSWSRGVLCAAGFGPEHITLFHDVNVAAPDALRFIDSTGVVLAEIAIRDDAVLGPTDAKALLDQIYRTWLPPCPGAIPEAHVRACQQHLQQAALAAMSGADPTQSLRAALTLVTALLTPREAQRRPDVAVPQRPEPPQTDGTKPKLRVA